MILLLDIGNTHTHVGWADGRGVLRQWETPSSGWKRPESMVRRLRVWLGRASRPNGICMCSVVPRATTAARTALTRAFKIRPHVLTHRSLAGTGLGVNYPEPSKIGPDRLANAIAARQRWGAPVVVVDFGTAVTFDVVNRRGDYVGGVIAPGLAAMTDYLHEKTALLPAIKIREPRSDIGRNTEEAMLIGAVHGYRGLVEALIGRLQRALGERRLPVVATGGYADLLAKHVPAIRAVDRALTLDGLRRAWLTRAAE